MTAQRRIGDRNKSREAFAAIALERRLGELRKAYGTDKIEVLIVSPPMPMYHVRRAEILLLLALGSFANRMYNLCKARDHIEIIDAMEQEVETAHRAVFALF